jgi:hypothetical protein
MTGVDSYLRFLIRCVEALTRAGEVDRRLLPKAVNMFEVRSQHLPFLADIQTLMSSCTCVEFFRISFSTLIMLVFVPRKYLMPEKRAFHLPFFFVALMNFCHLTYVVIFAIGSLGNAVQGFT